jgi:predicted nucleic acid-binding protein
MANKIVIGHRKLKSLPDKIYFDSSILLSAHLKDHKFYKKAVVLMTALTFFKAKAYLSPLCFSEVWWAIICREIYEKVEKKGKIYGKYKDYIKQNPEFILRCTEPLSKFMKFISIRLKTGRFELLDMPYSIIDDAYDKMISIRMTPPDAFHFAVTLKHNINAMATADTDFDSIPDEDFQIYSVVESK